MTDDDPHADEPVVTRGPALADADAALVLVVPQSGFPSVTVSPGNAEPYDVIVAATDSAVSSTALTQTITISGDAP